MSEFDDHATRKAVEDMAADMLAVGAYPDVVRLVGAARATVPRLNEALALEVALAQIVDVWVCTACGMHGRGAHACAVQAPPLRAAPAWLPNRRRYTP